jgi:hypothetical protein
MRKDLFNSSYEMGLRILMLLAANKNISFSLERIVDIDFISCYSEEFKISKFSLHGENRYMYGELLNRKLLAREAIKNLVKNGFVDVIVNRCYRYQISKTGYNYSESFESDYAKEYKTLTEIVTSKYVEISDDELRNMIQNYSLEALKGGK